MIAVTADYNIGQLLQLLEILNDIYYCNIIVLWHYVRILFSLSIMIIVHTYVCTCEGSTPGDITSRIGSDDNVSVSYSRLRLNIGDNSFKPTHKNFNVQKLQCTHTERL